MLHRSTSRRFAPSISAACCASEGIAGGAAQVLARGEIAQTELTAAEDTAINGRDRLAKAARPSFCNRRRVPRRSYHSFFYRQLGDITIDVVGGAAHFRRR